MAIFKCKMCGGNLDIVSETSVASCDYCGTKQTVPKIKDDITTNLFNRANNLRLKCEFDKAEQIYKKILDIDNSISEAHWGIVLCKYGIEYVEDPKTYKRIPTCHRTLYEAITTDVNYLSAIQNSDGEQRTLYIEEAKAIYLLQKNILNIVNSEKPFDVFICYKETDSEGKRTIDSSIANEIYYELTDQGYKVFYAPITLEDKLGREYEPYIFAALNSAKVMLVVGTKPEYFDSVWVRNEWSRFLKLTKADRSKLLIPCYKDMDAYELPDEFAHLQAQDISKIGFITDIIRGIKKIVNNDNQKSPDGANSFGQVQNPMIPTITPLLKRVSLFLEDEDFDKADDFCEQVLNIDPENAEAYTYKLLVEYRCCSLEKLATTYYDIKQSKNYAKIIRFGGSEQISAIEAVCSRIVENINNYYKEQQKISANNYYQSQQGTYTSQEEYTGVNDPMMNSEIDERYYDFSCPKCHEPLAYTQWQIEESPYLTCPHCEYQFKVKF